MKYFFHELLYADSTDNDDWETSHENPSRQKEDDNNDGWETISTKPSRRHRKEGQQYLCCHPCSESKRAYVIPQHVEELKKCYWSEKSGKIRKNLPLFKEITD